jgi:hypothetical protein
MISIIWDYEDKFGGKNFIQIFFQFKLFSFNIIFSYICYNFLIHCINTIYKCSTMSRSFS